MEEKVNLFFHAVTKSHWEGFEMFREVSSGRHELNENGNAVSTSISVARACISNCFCSVVVVAEGGWVVRA